MSMWTHIIYLTIIAGLFIWLIRLEARVRHWQSMWYSELNRSYERERKKGRS